MSTAPLFLVAFVVMLIVMFGIGKVIEWRHKKLSRPRDPGQ